MKITDACVYPYPCGDSSVRRMALEAKALGYERLVASDSQGGELSGVQICTGLVLGNITAREIASRTRQERNTQAVISVQAGANGFNRAVISTRGVHILRGIHSADKNAFDHVAAKMAADNRVGIDIDIAPLVSGRGISRQRAINRYRDILVLERRFEFPLVISSHARSVLEMRSTREIAGLCSLLGMDTEDIKKAFLGVDRVLSPQRPAVTVIG